MGALIGFAQKQPLTLYAYCPEIFVLSLLLFDAFSVFTNPTAYFFDAKTFYLLRSGAVNALFSSYIIHTFTLFLFQRNLTFSKG